MSWEAGAMTMEDRERRAIVLSTLSYAKGE